MKKAILIDNLKHQDIGGKEIVIEEEKTLDYFLDKNFGEMVIAETNFIARRMDLFLERTDEECKKVKCYYGHVGIFGYWVCEDEIAEVIE